MVNIEHLEKQRVGAPKPNLHLAAVGRGKGKDSNLEEKRESSLRLPRFQIL